MYCRKCGAKNEDGVKFCVKCGEKLCPDNIDTEQKTEEKRHSLRNIKVFHTIDPNDPKKTTDMKSLPMKTLVGILVIGVALVAIIGLIVNSAPTINLNDYVIVETEGYDGYGTASIGIDWDAMEEKYGDKVKYKSKARSIYGDELEYMTPVGMLWDRVSVYLDRSEGLSNGDSVAIQWYVEEDISDYVTCKVEYKDDTYSVDGLTAIGEFNPFDLLEITFSGTSPRGSVSIEYKGSDLSQNDFYCNRTTELRNGDNIVVSMKNTDISYYVEKFGKVPVEMEKSYTVKGLDEYISEYQVLPDDFISTCKNEAEDEIYAYTAGHYRSSVTLTDLEYSGYMLSSTKEGKTPVYPYNQLYMIFKGKLSSSRESITAANVYYPVRFLNVVTGENGQRYEKIDRIVGVSQLDGWNYTDGYINPIECYMEILEEDKSDYSIECGGDFEYFSSYKPISRLDDISEKYKETLADEAKDVIESYIAKNYYNTKQVDHLQVAGEYLLIAKDQAADYENNNKYYIVYSADVSSPKGSFDAVTVYYPVEYNAVVKLPDGDFMTTSSGGIQGKSHIKGEGDTKGYIDGSKMYSEVVIAHRDNYTFEVSEGLKTVVD